MMSRIFWAAMLFLCSCSAPRYTYFFNQPPATASEIKPVAVTPVITPPESGQFSSSRSPAVSPAVGMPAAVAKPFDAPKAKAMTITEKETDNAKLVKAKGGMDADLQRSIIFGASGIVALVIGGQVFWVLGSLSLLIGLIFGIKWLLRK
jgi:hypothetical protein